MDGGAAPASAFSPSGDGSIHAVCANVARDRDDNPPQTWMDREEPNAEGPRITQGHAIDQHMKGRRWCALSRARQRDGGLDANTATGTAREDHGESLAIVRHTVVVPFRRGVRKRGAPNQCGNAYEPPNANLRVEHPVTVGRGLARRQGAPSPVC